MQALCMLLAAVSVLADDSEDRRSKLPFVADAVGNALAPPPSGPATVGSPVNLLTPDRYEFYTFDESGELVKRLMTLEEIQAIVAAGEETEGLVTFANENQPTIAFNFSQPPYTKVHNVVTNVQNVLKAQMEAHKNKPQTKPTLDTPDVSDSWSLILPSIFGNTGVDIVPDKTSGTFSTPETETFELDDEHLLNKEGNNVVTDNTNTVADETQKDIPVTEKIPSTTIKENTVPAKTTTNTQKPRTTTTVKPTTKISTAEKPSSSTTSKPRTTAILKPTSKPLSTTSGTTKSQTITTTIKPRITLSTTRPRPTTTLPRTTAILKPTTKTNVRTTSKSTTTKPSPTATKPNPTTNKSGYTTEKTILSQTSTTQKEETNLTQIHTFSNSASTTVQTTKKPTIYYEKISTYVPVSTAAYVTEKTTQTSQQTTKAPDHSSATKRSTLTPVKPLSSASKIQPTTYKPTTYKSSTTPVYVSTKKDGSVKFNITTVTTQSVSPSTTMASTEFVSIGTNSHITKNRLSSTTEKNNYVTETEEEIPLFDISESFSQIATDLGNIQPVPTSGDLPDTTKINNIGMESKENLEIDIPADNEKEIKPKTNASNVDDDIYVKISTVTPPSTINNELLEKKQPTIEILDNFKPEASESLESSTYVPVTSTIDPVVSGSMEDLLSQIVNQSPQAIVAIDKNTNEVTTASTEKEVKFTTQQTTPIPNVITETSTAKVNEDLLTPAQDFSIDSRNQTTNIFMNGTVPGEIKEEPINNVSSESMVEHEISEINKNATENVTLHNLTEKYMEKVELSSSTTPESDINVNKTGHNHLNSSSQASIIDDSTINPQNNEKVEVNVQSQENKDEVFYVRSTTKSPLQQDKNIVNETENVSIKSENTLSQPEFTHNKLVTGGNDKIIMKEKDTEPGTKVDDVKKKIQKVNIDDKEFSNERNNSWKLISTVTPPKANEIPKDKLKTENQEQAVDKDKNIFLDYSMENQGLEVTTKNLGEDVAQFTELCNELAFRYWQTMIESIDKKRSFVLSPYSITSMLAMIFMGARGATSGEMNDILKLDDMVTFNPHFTLKNISDSIETSSNTGVVVSAFIRELFSNRDKGRILTFYKERASHFYNGHVEEVNFKLISDIIRRRTNLLVKRYTWGRIQEYMKSNTITMQPPLAAFSANIFQTDCSGSSVDGRDGEMYFVVSPTVRQRRLVPVPAVVYRTGFLAGYDPVLDATAAALGTTSSTVSTLFLMPGQQGNIVHSDDLEALEKRLLDSNPTTPAWNRLLRTLLPRIGLELQIPRFLHMSIFNVSSTLRKMGLKDLFDEEHADLGGIIGPTKDLYVSDMIQSTTFVTCGEGVIGEQHHMEEYPESLGGPQRRRTSRWATGWEEPRDYQRAFHDPHDVGEAMHLPLHLRPRQARLPARNAQPARLKFDRPFLYFVRHNPTGMILYVGRYNPRLLP